MSRKLLAATVAVALGAGALAAHATPIAIYNTGTAASGSGLAPAGGADPHWSITATPGSSTPAAAYDVSSRPAGWTASNPASQWISVAANGKKNQPKGLYDYQTSFDLTGLDASTASLSGSFAVNNCVTDILINGVSTGLGSSGTCGSNTHFKSFTAFSITTGFISGMNTLTFIVRNSGTGASSTGLNVLVSGNARPPAVPEPAALGWIGLALLGLGGLWLRRRA